MFETPSLDAPQPSVLTWPAVLSFCAVVMTALLGYFGARFTATAPLQVSLNAAFRELMEGWQTERARLIARISELEGEVLRQRGEIKNHLQVIQSQQRIIERKEEASDGHTPPQ